MKSLILDALSKLDPMNESHWTADGLPLVDAVRAIAADNDLSRSEITEAAPEFSRVNFNALPTISEPERLIEVDESELTVEEKSELIVWLEAQVTDRTASRARVLANKKVLEKEAEELQSQIDGFTQKLLSLNPPPDLMQEIQLCLKTQHKHKILEYEQRKHIPPDPRSALDLSFSRPNRRPMTM